MSVNNPSFLQKTALDVQIQYQNATIQTPINMVAGTGLTNIIEIDTPDILEYEMTATGDVSVALMPVAITGKIHLHPQSPALQAVQTVIKNYYLLQIIVPGTISVSSKAGGWSYTFQNVVFSTPFAGYNVSKVVDDYVYNFKATVPGITSISNLVNSAAGIANLV